MKIKEKARKAKTWVKEHKQVVAAIGSGLVSGAVVSVIHALCNKRTGLGDGTTCNDMYPCEIEIDGEPATAYIEADANKNVLGFWVDMKDRIITDKED